MKIDAKNQADLVREHENLLQQLNEKQTLIESIMKVCFIKYSHYVKKETGRIKR